MDITVTAITAGTISLIFLVLSFRVIGIRKQTNVSLGDGGNEPLQRAIRGQANFAEYAPIGVILLLVAELQSVNTYLLIAVAGTLITGRMCHGYAFAFTAGSVTLRRGGTFLTFSAIISLAVVNLVMPFAGWLT